MPPGESNGTPLQYSCLENPMDGAAWQAAVHGVTQSQTRPSDFTFTFHFHALEKEIATHSSVLAWRIPGRGAWWAAVYGVAQSRTWLEQLSSSSSRWWCHLVASLQICKRSHLFKFSISGSNIFIFPFPTLFQLLPCYLISYYLFYSVKFVRKISKHSSPIMANKREYQLYIYISLSLSKYQYKRKKKKKAMRWMTWTNSHNRHSPQRPDQGLFSCHPVLQVFCTALTHPSLWSICLKTTM